MAESATPSFWRLQRKLAVDVLAVTIPLLGVLLFAKTHKLLLAKGLGVGEIMAAFCSDLIFAALWMGGWGLVLHAARTRQLKGWVQMLITRGFQMTTWLAIVLVLIEHFFHVKTGTYLDWYLIRYALDQLHQVDKVIMSEAGVAAGALAVLLGLAYGWAVLVRRLPFVRKWLATEWGLGDARKGLYVFFALLILTSGFRSFSKLPQSGLQRTPAFALATQAFASIGSGLNEQTVTAQAELNMVRIEPREPNQHNLIVVILESVRASATGIYEPFLTTTPFMQELAQEGRVVDRAYTVIPHTSKALVAILCGIFPKVTTPIVEAAVGGMPTRCLAELLSSEGYATAFFQPAEERFEGRADLVKNMGFENFFGKETLARPGFEESNYFGYEDDIMLEPAAEWIDQQDKPFFLTLLTLTAHHTYKVPKSIEKRDFGHRGRFNDYLNTVHYTDRFLRKLFDDLEERGLRDNTVVMIMGDHGEAFGEHGRNEHDAVLYEEGVRVPLVLVGPGTGEAGTRIAGLRQAIDILPTSLEVLGFVGEGGDLPGKSVLTSEGHDQLFFSCWYRDNCLASIVGNQKFLYHYGKRPIEVFDLKADPGERKNLAPDMDKEGLALLEGKVKAWMGAANARFLSQPPRSKAALVSREAKEPQIPLDIVFGDFVRLRGVDVVKQTIPRGRSIEVTYHYEVLKDPGASWYRALSQVLNQEGNRVGWVARVPAEGSHPVSAWRAGEHIRDPHRVFVQHGSEIGEHYLTLMFPNVQDENKVELRALPKGTKVDDQRRAVVIPITLTPGNRG